MAVNTEELRALSAVEKLRLVEFLWDELGHAATPIPIPDWVDREASKRRDEIRDPVFGLSHDEAWKRIDSRNG